MNERLESAVSEILAKWDNPLVKRYSPNVIELGIRKPFRIRIRK